MAAYISSRFFKTGGKGEEMEFENKFVDEIWRNIFLLLFFPRRANGAWYFIFRFFLSCSFSSFFFYHFHERLKSFDQMVLSVDPNGSRYTGRELIELSRRECFRLFDGAGNCFHVFYEKFTPVIDRAEARANNIVKGNKFVWKESAALIFIIDRIPRKNTKKNI